MPRETRDVIFGRGIRDPVYNAAGTFFGISQLKMPTENCPRILISFFIYFCLVFRTCYQGRMFEFMTTDIRKPPPETIEDLAVLGYKIIVSYITYLYFLPDYIKEEIEQLYVLID